MISHLVFQHELERQKDGLLVRSRVQCRCMARLDFDASGNVDDAAALNAVKEENQRELLSYLYEDRSREMGEILSELATGIMATGEERYRELCEQAMAIAEWAAPRAGRVSR